MSGAFGDNATQGGAAPIFGDNATQGGATQGGRSSTSGSWLTRLQPASWRGVPFAVRTSEYRRGRRVAVHEYPFRDQAWAEDVGRASRMVEFSGFVVGDDCYQQARALLNAAEQPSTGTLVHPSLGRLTVALVEPLTCSERAELGRVVEIKFAFIETGEPLYPGNTTSTQSVVADKATALNSAASGDFFSQAGSALSAGSAAIHQAIATTQGFINQGLSVVNDASRVVNSVSGLGAVLGSGFSLGRFSGGGLGGIIGAGSPLGSALQAVNGITSTVSRVEAGANAAIGQAVQLGSAVQSVGARLSGLAASL